MSASWRHPFLAPLYALVISFGFVVLFGAVLGQPPQTQTVIRVVAEGANPLPQELTELSITIRKPDGKHENAGGGKIDKGSYTVGPDVSVADHLVCIQPPAPWMVTAPATKEVIVDLPNPVTCTEPIPNPPAQEIVLKLVKGATVRAMAEPYTNDVPAEFAGVLVQIRELDGAPGTEMGRLDARGRLALPRPVTSRLVCLQPPPGWVVAAPQTTDKPGTKCTKASGDDIVFTLRRGGGG